MFSGENFVMFSFKSFFTLPFFSSFYHRGICQIFTNTFKEHTEKTLNGTRYFNALLSEGLGTLSSDFSASPRIKAEKHNTPTQTISDTPLLQKLL